MRESSSKPRNDSGATFAHTLVALAVLVAMSAASYPLASSAIAALGKAADSAFGASRALVADASIRALAARVRAPFWAASIEPANPGDAIEAPWLDGEMEKPAVIAWDGEALRIGEAEAAFRVGGLEHVELAWLEDGRGRVLGFALAFETGGRAWRVEAPFGAFPRPRTEGTP
ncbi:MAG TPA: hypothetical protein PKW82_10635 [Spirochaetales bacterium]|nr:hypothetical protein [Spirochaetales bacterium]